MTNLLFSHCYSIISDNILLEKYYVEIKYILSFKIHHDILDLIIRFIDMRKTCIVCKVLFNENNIYYEHCHYCNEICCKKCLNKEHFTRCPIRNCYYCMEEWYNDRFYYYCKICDELYSNTNNISIVDNTYYILDID